MLKREKIEALSTPLKSHFKKIRKNVNTLTTPPKKGACEVSSVVNLIKNEKKTKKSGDT